MSDDTTPRWVTTTCSLDYSTTAVADKFGNLAIVRLPHNTNDDVTEDPTGTQSLWDRGLLSGASQKADCVSVTHIGKICPLVVWSLKIFITSRRDDCVAIQVRSNPRRF